MKNFVKILTLFLAYTTMISVSFAQEGRWGNRGATPFQVFDNVAHDANEGHYDIQDTALDGITDLQGSFEGNNKITNTLDYIRKHISPYIQRAVYVGFVASTAGLIICGFLLVTGGIGKSGGFEKVKGKIINALLGVFVLSGFYLIIQLMVGLINTFFGS